MYTNSFNTRQQLLDFYRDAIRSGLSIKDVEQEISEVHQMVQEAKGIDRAQQLKAANKRRMRKLAPIVLMTVGSILIANALWPIIYHTIFVSPLLTKARLESPVAQDDLVAPSAASNQAAVAQARTDANLIKPRPKPVILNQQLDFSNLSNWFTDQKPVPQQQTDEVAYTVDIPSLSIEQAEVKIGGTDLNHSLIHYPGTADPGAFGAPVIFGHSVLRQFYNPDLTNPSRYKSIFSKIMTMEPGDEIFITEQGIKYTYVVEDKHEVEPEDRFILEQRHTSRELKLITCVPEGTYLRRGVVLAKLVKVE